jgi:hypothetical protein
VDTEFWWEKLWKSDHLEDLGIDAGLLLEYLCKTSRCEVHGWIDLAQVRQKYRAVVNTVMNLRVP